MSNPESNALNTHFDWSNDPLVQHQAATAIYWDDFGHLVIRQQAGPNAQIDSCIVLTPDNVRRVARRMLVDLGDYPISWLSEADMDTAA
jgi:hypothetical protein